MLPKRQRLTKEQFEVYFKSGKRYHSPHLQLIYTPTHDFHAAVVVGKKVFKRAVDRNRMRRRLYGVLYRFHTLNATTGVYLLIAKPGAKQLTRHDLYEETKQLLKNAVRSKKL